MRATGRAGLTRDQIEAFERDGYLVVPVYAPHDLDPVRDAINAWIDARLAQLAARGRRLHTHADAAFGIRGALLAAQYPRLFTPFDLTSVLVPALFDHLADARMLAVAGDLLGPGTLALNPIHHLRMKPSRPYPGSDSGYFNVPWHQDSSVMTADTDAHRVLTCWRPLGAASVEMGCLQVLPGVHRLGHLPHIATDAGPAIDPSRLPDVEPVQLPCRPGEVVIMSQFTPHHSTPNVADVCRWSIDARYQRADAPSGRGWQPLTPLTGPQRASPQSWAAAWAQCAADDNLHVYHRIDAAAGAALTDRSA